MASEVVRLVREREGFRQQNADHLSRRFLAELEMDLAISVPETDPSGKPFSEARRSRHLAEARARSPEWRDAQARAEDVRRRLSALDAELEVAQVRFRALEAVLGYYTALLRFHA